MLCFCCSYNLVQIRRQVGFYIKKKILLSTALMRLKAIGGLNSFTQSINQRSLKCMRLRAINVPSVKGFIEKKLSHEG